MSARILRALGTIVVLFGSSFLGAYLGSQVAQRLQPAGENAFLSPVASWWLWTTHDTAGFYTFILDILTGLVAMGGGLLAIFTYHLWASGEGQLKANRRSAFAALQSAKVARESFARLERPYVYIFGLHWADSDRTTPGGAAVALSYQVANYGRTPAQLTEARVGFTVGTTPAAADLLGVHNAHPLSESPILTANETRVIDRHELPEGISEGDGGILVELAGDPSIAPLPNISGGDLFIRIIIRYSGPFTRDHETSACWIWRQGDQNPALYRNGAAYSYIH
jgi:hypothetical protein